LCVAKGGRMRVKERDEGEEKRETGETVNAKAKW
jgi:hypothetical protein